MEQLFKFWHALFQCLHHVMTYKNTMRVSWLGHFCNNCVTPDSVKEYWNWIKLSDLKNKKNPPSFTEFWKISDDKPRYFFNWPYMQKPSASISEAK